MHTSLALALAFVLIPVAVPAQTVYDDFSGASLDGAKWFRFLDHTRSTQANGVLRMWGRGYFDRFGVLSLSGLEGDFEVTMEFNGFRSGGVDGGVMMFLSDAEGLGANTRDTLIGIGKFRDSRGNVWTGFSGEMQRNDVYVGGGAVPSTATAGAVRIVRQGNAASLYCRAAGQTGFTQMGSTVTNFFVSRFAYFGVEMDLEDEDGADANIDAITYRGKLVSNVKAYGKRCLGLDAIPLGYPRVGNSSFRVVVLGGMAFRHDPFQFTIGVQRTAIPLNPAGAVGCSLYTDPIVTLSGKLSDEGEAQVPLPVPNDPSLRGIVFRAQFAASTNRNAMGLAWSNGIECQIF